MQIDYTPFHHQVVITGCATDFCIDATVKSSLHCDFNTTVLSDGYTTTDRPNLKAKEVIDYFNWIWSETFPTKGILKVISTAGFIRRLS